MKMRPNTMKVLALAAIVAPFCFLFSLGTVFLTGVVQTPSPTWYRVGLLSDFANDGTPQLTTVYAKRRDAWMQQPDRRVCEVFVRRHPETDAILIVPPWHSWRIPIRYNSLRKQYESCCWKVRFDLDGREYGDSETRAGDLTPLLARVQESEIWVLLNG